MTVLFAYPSAILLANPNDLKTRLDVVRFVNSTRGTDAAIAEVQAFIKAEPDNMAIDEKESARREFEKALKLAGDNPFPFHDEVEQAMKTL